MVHGRAGGALLHRVLSCIRFPDIYADLLLGYWEAFRWLRTFDPHKELIIKAVSLPAPQAALVVWLCWCAVHWLLNVLLHVLKKQQWIGEPCQQDLPHVPNPLRKPTPLSFLSTGFQWLRVLN